MGLPTSDCQRVSVGATGALPGGLNKVRRDGGEGAPAALTAFGTTTAASESGVG